MGATKVNAFSNFVLRSPAYSFLFYKKILDDYSFDKLITLYEESYIKEAISIASPDLIRAIEKYKSNTSPLSIEKKEALEISLLKYLSRISTRCTPFGLFAGCAVGSFFQNTDITLEKKDNFTRVTQFDMTFWSSLLQEFAQRENVRPHLIYYPNNSIYSFYEFYRYVEYSYKDNKREHKISAIRKSSYLDILLEKSKSGLNITQLVEILSSDDNDKEDALSYINELINSQILTSNIDPTITGNDEFERILTIIEKIPTLKKEHEVLSKIKNEFLILDEKIVPNENNYSKIKNLITDLGVGYDEKYLFQTDMNISTKVNHIDFKIEHKVREAIYFLNGIVKHEKLNNYSKFIKSFIERYETREMPLTKVLDTELGIGYYSDGMKDTNSLLDQFAFQKKNNPNHQENWTNFDFILQRKILECNLNNSFQLSLSEEDFPDFEPNLDNAPLTFSVMIELLRNDGKEEIIFESCGGISAAKLLGRFCNVNQSIFDLTREIIKKEDDHYPDKIFAEIVHTPQDRTGNILRRPVLRKHEIAYLSASTIDTENKIELSDLMISIRNEKIILRSKNNNKEIIPCLSNAHNFSKNALPLYHFLCDLQSQDFKQIYSFSWGVLEYHYIFFPRVYYKNVILAKAKWIVNKEEVSLFYKLKDEELLNHFLVWKRKRNLPRYINWVQSDNTLLLDLERTIGIKLFLNSVKNFNSIVLEEFLFSNDAIVKNELGESFTNQIIMPFYKEITNND